MSLVILMTGCSRYVTPIVTYGSQLTVEVTFRGNLDTDRFRYFMIFSTQEAFSYPVPPPEGTTLDEFLEPGDLPVSGDNSSYFTNYYSTWTAYIVLNSAGYYLAKGPFISTVAISKESVGLSEVPNKFTFTVSLSRVFGTTIPDFIYFDVISADYPAGSYKYLQDRLAPPTQSISKVSGSLISGNRPENADLDAGLDIISWKARVD